jgi:nucleoside-diphosphate-sugar epimerase
VIFLTGATGYVGMRIGQHLAEQGGHIRCLVPYRDPRESSIRFPSEVVRGDLTDLATFAPHGKGVKTIVHTAATRRPGRIRNVNVLGTENVLAFARRWRVRRIVHVSPASTLHSSKDVYAAWQSEAERLVMDSGLDYTILRLAMVYGAGGARPFRSLVERVQRIPFVCPIAGPGTALLQPVYVGDVVRAVELVLSTPAASRKTYDVAGASVVPLDELVDRISAAQGLRRWPVHLPLSVCGAAAGTLSSLLPPSVFRIDGLIGLAPDRALDHTRFQEECGYRPLTLEQGFARVFGGGAAVG